MKIIGIEHIGIAVKNIREASPFWNHVLQIGHSTTEDVDDQGVITDIYDTGKGKVELLQAKYPDSPVAKFLDRRGPGIHHICLQVEDIDEAIQELKSEGIQLIGNGAPGINRRCSCGTGRKDVKKVNLFRILEV